MYEVNKEIWVDTKRPVWRPIGKYKFKLIANLKAKRESLKEDTIKTDVRRRDKDDEIIDRWFYREGKRINK